MTEMSTMILTSKRVITSVDIMSTKKKTKKKYKRIHNPLTGKYYLAEVLPDGRYRIVGLWHPPKKTQKKKKSVWDLLG